MVLNRRGSGMHYFFSARLGSTAVMCSTQYCCTRAANVDSQEHRAPRLRTHLRYTGLAVMSDARSMSCCWTAGHELLLCLVWKCDRRTKAWILAKTMIVRRAGTYLSCVSVLIIISPSFLEYPAGIHTFSATHASSVRARKVCSSAHPPP